jgi:hypothetical protein
MAGSINRRNTVYTGPGTNVRTYTKSS